MKSIETEYIFYYYEKGRETSIRDEIELILINAIENITIDRVIACVCVCVNAGICNDVCPKYFTIII